METENDSFRRKLLHVSDGREEGRNCQVMVAALGVCRIKAAALVEWVIDAPVENNPVRLFLAEDETAGMLITILDMIPGNRL